MKASRRKFLRNAVAGLAAPAVVRAAQAAKRPNVIILITDDQGYGDLSLHGNEMLKTPNLDAIAKAGVQFTQFHSSPVCSPTRSSLMTGRYNYRTGVVDTFLGRSMMYPDEVTLAEMLAGAGYRTGIFGKWHLGDNYPLRAMDQGFQESLVHNGGGVGQPSDPPGNTYFDPVLKRNGRAGKRAGYCTDIFFEAAMEFIAVSRGRPFFTYLATNAPHTPLEVADSYVAPFRALGLDDTTARVYGMVANLDENVGRLRARLKQLEIERDTLLIYMTDNGPQQKRYNAGMRGLKGSVYEGGIRVPCFLQWPGTIAAGGKVDRLAAHIDLLPTVLDACGVRKPAGPALDGRSLMPLLQPGAYAPGRPPVAPWPDRTLFFQWHRGDQPELYRNCAARNQRYKLVEGRELYDLESDPAEQRDIAAENPQVVAQLRQSYERWFHDVSSTRGYAPPRPLLGTDFENPVTLTRQDWRGAAGWDTGTLGHWEVEVGRAGAYDITLRMDPAAAAGEAHFLLNGVARSQSLAAGAGDCRFLAVALPAGKGRLEAFLTVGGARVGVRYVDVFAPQRPRQSSS